MFELKTPTKVRVLDVRVLSKKDRKPDEHPGLQFLMQATLGVDVLGQFGAALPGALYKAKDRPQGELTGIESAELTEIGEHVKRLPWVYEQTGCSIQIDWGLGNISLSDALTHRVSIRPEQKGVVVQWTMDVPALNDSTRGKLTGLKSTEVQITLRGPVPEQEAQAPIPGISGAESKAALDASGVSPFPAGGRRGGARPAAAVE